MPAVCYQPEPNKRIESDRRERSLRYPRALPEHGASCAALDCTMTHRGFRQVLRALAIAGALFGGTAQGADYGVLKYGKGRTFHTGVFGPKYIGLLPAKGKAPYLVFSGRSCDECDANRTIYIHSPDDGPMLGGERDPRYTYPGQ